MKILHKNGFDDAEMINIRYIAQSNIIQAMDQLIDGINQLKIILSQPDQV